MVTRRRVAVADIGATVVEVSIASLVLTVVLTLAFSTLSVGQEVGRSTEARKEAYDRLRVAAAGFSREARQATTPPTIAADGSSATFKTYAGGVVQTVTWRISPTAPFDLERCAPTCSGSSLRTYSVSLMSRLNAFAFDPSTNVLRVSLRTSGGPRVRNVTLTSEVQLRNV